MPDSEYIRNDQPTYSGSPAMTGYALLWLSISLHTGAISWQPVSRSTSLPRSSPAAVQTMPTEHTYNDIDLSQLQGRRIDISTYYPQYTCFAG